MVLVPTSMDVWVSDTEGFISVWDAQVFINFFLIETLQLIMDVQTLQRCYKFKVNPEYCAQNMAFLYGNVLMAVGKDLMIVNAQVFYYLFILLLFTICL